MNYLKIFPLALIVTITSHASASTIVYSKVSDLTKRPKNSQIYQLETSKITINSLDKLKYVADSSRFLKNSDGTFVVKKGKYIVEGDLELIAPEINTQDLINPFATLAVRVENPLIFGDQLDLKFKFNDANTRLLAVESATTTFTQNVKEYGPLIIGLIRASLGLPSASTAVIGVLPVPPMPTMGVEGISEKNIELILTKEDKEKVSQQCIAYNGKDLTINVPTNLKREEYTQDIKGQNGKNCIKITYEALPPTYDFNSLNDYKADNVFLYSGCRKAKVEITQLEGVIYEYDAVVADSNNLFSLNIPQNGRIIKNYDCGYKIE